ncbi:MAG TPA: POT family MFS transporter [Polyangiales bacterium]|jgi:POT family proton-dependent oligopeptide transporter|nr:POT family MFS transporter [Polyangiales bacterium]
MAEYRTLPEDIDRMPGGVPFIVGNELAERFSYYGMRAILVVFMTTHLKDSSGALATMTPEQAKAAFHTFGMAAYFMPLLGAILSDAWLGKYRTIMIISLGYCLGHAALAIDDTRLGLVVGLSLIAIGSGGIKPCVSAHVGDQFGPRNQHLLERVFGWFYFSINLGSFAAQLLIPVLLERSGPSLAFGVPGVLMGIATLIFWLGRHRFAHIEPAGIGFVRELMREPGRSYVLRLFTLTLFISVFWALSEQHGSAWVLQAERMDRNVFGVTFLASQIQAINPVLVLTFIPLTSYVIYPGVSRVFKLTALRKIGIGFVFTVAAFALSAFIETRLDAGANMHIGWQLAAYVLMTFAEVLIYGTGLEFFYSQAPNRLKSFVMAIFLLSLSIGNGIAALVNLFIQDEHGHSRITGATYYLTFAGCMLLTSVLFAWYARTFREQRFIQGTEDPTATPQGAPS